MLGLAKFRLKDLGGKQVKICQRAVTLYNWSLRSANGFAKCKPLSSTVLSLRFAQTRKNQKRLKRF
jgi:hypothetical protein